MDTSLLIPALLTGIFCYLGAIETPWFFGMSGGFYIIGRPLVAGLLCGIAFGDIQGWCSLWLCSSSCIYCKFIYWRSHK